jgi:hypothetical protein
MPVKPCYADFTGDKCKEKGQRRPKHVFEADPITFVAVLQYELL